MQRVLDKFLDRLANTIPVRNKRVLEIGCGSGYQTLKFANIARSVIAIDPDIQKIREAQETALGNVRFGHGSAEALAFDDSTFHVVVFTLSFHHLRFCRMKRAIDEAIRVTKPFGFIVFLEPGTEGSFFQAEIQFDACDGDERVAKEEAYEAMTTHEGLVLVEEFTDETIFRFETCDDFLKSMTPRKNQVSIREFLKFHNYTLRATRRINIFRPKK